ncbi:MAG: site-specific integrase [Candidatus Obscuribacter sp.]|nr:site-specific integrase [Candidatus Obscuribacter sp.]MBP6350013.1 site-specific integrase [Candidatus Obscuribacter sp.]
MNHLLPSTADPTLLDCLRCYFEHKPLKLRTKSQYEAVLRRCFPDWLYRGINSITRRDVEERHKELSLRGKYQANFAGRVLRALYIFAEGYYVDADGEPIIKNPMKIMSAKNLWNKETRRQRRITAEQMPRFFNALLLMPNRHAADYILFLLLTGARRSEAAQLLWSDIDLNRGTATAKDTKSRRDHVFPLCDVLWSLLKMRFVERCPAQSDPVFTAPNGVDAISRYDRSHLFITGVSGVVFCLHDLRRTVASVAVETGTHLYSIKRILNHSIDLGGWTEGYVVADQEHLRSCVQVIADTILSQAGIDKRELIKKLK